MRNLEFKDPNYVQSFEALNSDYFYTNVVVEILYLNLIVFYPTRDKWMKILENINSILKYIFVKVMFVFPY